MRKIEESEVLGRYNRIIQKAPLHEKLTAVKNATGEKIQRCVSEDAPDELAKLFAPKCSHEFKENMNDFELGRMHFIKGDMDKALRHLENAYSKGEIKAAPYLGKIYYDHMIRPDDALPFFLKAAGNLEMPELYPVIGKIYQNQNDPDGAIVYYEMAFSQGQSDVYDELAQIYEQTGKPEKAAEIYEDAFKMGQNNALGHLLEIFRSEGDFEEKRGKLLARLNEADRNRMKVSEGYFYYTAGKITCDENLTQDGLQRMFAAVTGGAHDSWEMLFEAYIWEGMVGDAIDLCRLLINKKKNAYAKLAELYMKMDKFDWAEKTCKEGVKNGDASCIYILGTIREKKRQTREALKLYEKAAHNNDYRAYMDMANIYEKEGNILKAKENYDYAFMTPSKKMMMFRYLNFLLKNGFHDEAAKVFVEAVEAGAHEKDIYKILFNTNDEVTIKLCDAALKAGHTQAQIWLAQYYLMDCDIPRAEVLLRQAAEAGNKEAHVLLAQCLYRQGRFDESKLEFDKAFKNKVNCYKEFAEVLESEGYIDQAILNYRMAIDRGDIRAYENLIMLLIRNEKLQEAQIIIDIAMRNGLPLEHLFRHFERTPEIGIRACRSQIPPHELN